MLSVLASVVVGQTATAPSIVPQPSSMTLKAGEYALSAKTRIAVTNDTRDLGDQLREYLRPATGYPLDTVRRGGRDTISLSFDKRLTNLGEEGYRLEVKSDRIEIKALKAAGIFYGMQTLRQLLPPAILRKSRVEGVDWTVPCLLIEDKPRFGWRGALIDSSRHFMPKEGILRFLDTLALHKLNSFHWHLTDDNGWRIEIRKYPKLTEIGAWQPEWLPDYDPPKPKAGTRGGFYTQDDIREVVAYARDRHINVVPEIEMPGHAGAIIASYPEVGIKGSNVLNGEDSSIRFMQDVLDEVMELFPSKFIHVGGDEVDKGPWQKDARTQELMKQRGLKDENELQSWIIRQMDQYLTTRGRRLIGWDEILEGGLAPGATVMSWRGIEGGIAAAKAGHDVVMAPTSHTYLDYYQADPSHEPLAIGGFVPLDKVYAFEPIPSELTGDEAKHVLGLQGQLWAEFLPNMRHLEYMAWPRLSALAEVAWSPVASRNFEDYTRRLDVDLRRLEAMGVNYRPLVSHVDANAIGGWIMGDVNESWQSHEWPLKLHEPGSYKATFEFHFGLCRLDIAKVELLEDGKPVATDEHPGMTGSASKDNEYELKLAKVKPGATYSLRAQVRADGGTDSNGVVRWEKQ